MTSKLSQPTVTGPPALPIVNSLWSTYKAGLSGLNHVSTSQNLKLALSMNPNRPPQDLPGCWIDADSLQTFKFLGSSLGRERESWQGKERLPYLSVSFSTISVHIKNSLFYYQIPFNHNSVSRPIYYLISYNVICVRKVRIISYILSQSFCVIFFSLKLLNGIFAVFQATIIQTLLTDMNSLRIATFVQSFIIISIDIME